MATKQRESIQAAKEFAVKTDDLQESKPTPPGSAVVTPSGSASPNGPFRTTNARSPSGTTSPAQSGTSGTVGYESLDMNAFLATNGSGGGRGSKVLRPDIQNFIDKITRESVMNPEKNLAELFRFIKETGGTHSDLSSSSDYGGFGTMSSIGGSSIFGDESNEFLSSDRQNAAKPFVSDLTFRCVVQPDTGEAADFAPWQGSVALLFIDISGYSKVTSALAAKGAHTLSEVVNSYLMRILNVVVRQYDGDVVKFAGDAVMATWSYEDDLRRSCVEAARCALALQELCGEHAIEELDNEMSFTLHIGLDSGVVETDVFTPGNLKSMQRGFHFIGGEPLKAIGPIVDTAKSGEVCISSKVFELLGGDETVTVEKTDAADILRLTAVLEDEDPDREMPDAIDRPKGMERYFIHPSILRRLHHGIRPSDMAEMRLLAVLFIQMQGTTNVSDWFHEVCEVLDACRCPVVQIIDDDKGVHIVAAVNLFMAEANPADVGMAACRELADRQIECNVGIATGMVFCGVLGSDLSSRWDITGPACVRACRLMQFAEATADAPNIIIDSSVYDALTDISIADVHSTDVRVKGTDDAVTVYKLAATANDVTAKIVPHDSLSPLFPEEFDKLCAHITDTSSLRPIAIVSGGPAVGKRKLLERVANKHADHVPFVHLCQRNAPPLSIGATIAQWFSYHPDADIRASAAALQKAFEQRHTSKTLHAMGKIVEMCLNRKHKVIFIILHAEFLDSLSMSFLQSVHVLNKKATTGICTLNKGLCAMTGGRWVTLLSHVPIFGANSVSKLLSAMVHTSCPTARKKCPVFQVGVTEVAHFLSEGGAEGSRPYINSLSFMSHNHYVSGGFVGFMNGTYMLFSQQYFYRVKNNLPMASIASSCGYTAATKDGFELMRNSDWTKFAPTLTSKLIGCFDALPPRYQMIMKVIASMAAQDAKFPFPIAVVGQVTMSLVSRKSAKDIKHDINALKELELVETCGTVVSLRNYTMRDTIRALLTPKQIQAINEKCAKIYSMPPYAREDPGHLLIVARFFYHAGNKKNFTATIQKGWGMIKKFQQEQPEEYAKFEAEYRADEKEHLDFTKSMYSPQELIDRSNSGKGRIRNHGCQAITEGTGLNIYMTERQYIDSVCDLGLPLDETLGDSGVVREDSKYDKETVDVESVNHDFVRAKNITPSVAYGPLLHHVNEMGIILVEMCFAARRKRPPTDEQLKHAQRVADEYIDLVEQFETLIPPMVYSAEQKAAERARVGKWLEFPQTDSIEEHLKVARDFLEYTSTVVPEREKRACGYCVFMTELPANVDREHPVVKAFYKLQVDSKGVVDVQSFHSAIMELAMHGWHPDGLAHGRLTLATIRKDFLKDNKGVAEKVKAFLYLTALLKWKLGRKANC